MAGKIKQFFSANPDAEDEVDRRVVNASFDSLDLLDTLLTETEADMELFACKEATNAMQAYYKVRYR